MRACLLTSGHRALDDRIFHAEARSLVRAGYEIFLTAPHDRDEEARGGSAATRMAGQTYREHRAGPVFIRCACYPGSCCSVCDDQRQCDIGSKLPSAWRIEFSDRDERWSRFFGHEIGPA